MRVVIMKEFVKDKFPATPLLDYAIEVEKITTSKVRNNPYTIVSQRCASSHCLCMVHIKLKMIYGNFCCA